MLRGGMIASSQPARIALAEPASGVPTLAAGAPAGPSATPKSEPSASPPSDDVTEPPVEEPSRLTAEKRNDPADHPLVKGVMEKFAAKIVEVRKKEPKPPQ
jgi:hypothetical protein